jgi:diaminopimelate decarboxylase
VALPMPNVPIEEVVSKLKEQEAGFSLKLDNMGGGDIDYLTNKEAINKMNEWISKIGKDVTTANEPDV